MDNQLSFWETGAQQKPAAVHKTAGNTTGSAAAAVQKPPLKTHSRPKTGKASYNWSVSMHRRISTCARLYYLQHIASRGGTSANAAPQARRLAVLKTLHNRFTWVGDVVHRKVAEIMTHLRYGWAAEPEVFAQSAQIVWQQGFQESQTGRYKERIGKAVGLFEHEYALDLPASAWEQECARAQRCVRNFFKLPLYDTIRTLPQRDWLAMENLGRFVWRTAAVTAIPDFVFRAKDGAVVLVDWKTGARHEQDEDFQLAVYAFYAAHKGWTDSRGVRGIIAYLNDATQREVAIDPQTSQVPDAIANSIAALDRWHQGQPVEENFPKTDDLSRCGMCVFKRVCGRMETAADVQQRA